MHKQIFIGMVCCVLALGISHAGAGETTKTYTILDAHALNEKTIKQTIRKTAEYQLNRYGPNIPTKNWLVGTFFSSFIAAYEQTADEWYLEQALKWGEASEWDINNSLWQKQTWRR